jgi:hypothetical protein
MSRFHFTGKVAALVAVLFGFSANATDNLSNPVSMVALGNSCVNGDTSHICLGLKYVVYRDPSGNPVVSPADALKNVEHMNALHAQCGIAFQIEEFTVVDPTEYHLPFNIANMSDLDGIRETFGEPSRLLIVTTGKWRRTGSLGSTSANAWTAMPGSPPYGAVLEATVADYYYIFAHEIGHYLNLDHFDDSANLMNPIIYPRSTVLTQGQCATERTAAAGFWNQVNRGGSPVLRNSEASNISKISRKT